MVDTVKFFSFFRSFYCVFHLKNGNAETSTRRLYIKGPRKVTSLQRFC